MVVSNISSQQFQSTLSMRRATPSHMVRLPQICISIHALHEESDKDWGKTYLDLPISIHALHEESDPEEIPHRPLRVYHFNPRSP